MDILTVRVKLGAVAKHRAGDIKEPIADRAEGTCVAVTAQAQSGVRRDLPKPGSPTISTN
jgi:hypothetical protein